MEFAKSEVLEVLNYLLPGLVASWIFHLVTPHKKPSDLSAIIEALIFTAFVQPGVLLVGFISFRICESWACLGQWTDNSHLVVSIVIGFLLGIATGWASNKDIVHSLLRRFSLTKSTSFSSEWYGNFFREERYVTLHLKDGRRINGWPAEWPNAPDEGHFALTQALWLDEKNAAIRLSNTQTILVPVAEVVYVEFLKWMDELKNEQEAPAVSTRPESGI